MRLAAAALTATLLLAGCGGGDDTASSPAARPDHSRANEVSGSAPAQQGQSPSAPKTRLRRAQCPPAAANCRSASGRIVYVEAVDPDGDGDAHFVLLSSDGVTGPGISVIDVRRGLRPRPLPRVGDEISAAGPVYRGSFGQLQIQADALHVARR